MRLRCRVTQTQPCIRGSAASVPNTEVGTSLGAKLVIIISERETHPWLDIHISLSYWHK